jgi:delta 1-pyrroline-5-carboxylate dehydrogenase
MTKAELKVFKKAIKWIREARDILKYYAINE